MLESEVYLPINNETYVINSRDMLMKSTRLF